MSAILYGNLRAEIVGSAGVRLSRVTLRQATSGLLRPSRPEAPHRPRLLGRDREIANVLAAFQAGRPTGFHAACGYGKTTLLESIAATVSDRGLAASSIYLRADKNRVGDLLQQLVARLYVCDQPVKLTPQECAQLLGQVSAVIAIDDLCAGPEQIAYLLEVLHGCSLVIGSADPVLGGRGSSHRLGGLPEEAALALLADGLGRPLTGDESDAGRRLVAAVKGQPLRLRQCAALAREGKHSLQSLARRAAHNPEVLDRLSISALGLHERRALAVLALAAGVLLPAAVVESIGQLACLGEWLESLHRRGLAEQRGDRFGLPVCEAESYRQLLLKDLHLAASVRSLSSWLAVADPTSAESQSAAEAALAIMDAAAERGDWATVVRLASTAERALFIAGRWEAWHHTLGQGLAAARASADRAAEALFSHQQGTLAFCHDQLDEARRLLRQALTLRQQIGDQAGVALTRHNLRLLQPPDPPPPPRRRVPRRALTMAGSILSILGLAAGTVAITGAMRSGQPHRGQPTRRSDTLPAPPANTSLSQPPNSSSSSSQPPNSTAKLILQTIRFTSSPPLAPVVGGTYAAAAAGRSGNPVVLSIDPGSGPVCTISGSIVTFNNTGSCVIDANQAGNSTYAAAPQVQQTIRVGKTAQSISFAPPASASVGGSATFSATGGRSGNPVVFSLDPTSGPEVCSVSGTNGTTVNYAAAGSCVIDANQAGNSTYAAAPQVQQTIRVGKTAQSISFAPPASASVGGSATFSATGGRSGNPVVFSLDPTSGPEVCSVSGTNGTTVNYAAAGSCVIDANQAGNSTYAAAPQVQQTITGVGG